MLSLLCTAKMNDMHAYLQRAPAPDALSTHRLLFILLFISFIPPTLVMSDMVSYDTLQYSQALDVHNDSQDMYKSNNTRTKRIKPIPTRWRPPSSFIPRLIFRIMCFCLTFHWNLDFMWEIFREPNGWENFHTLYLTQINQLSTVVCWYIFQRFIFLIVLDSKVWSSRLSQSLSPLHPL
jgi:hypothetical protein